MRAELDQVPWACALGRQAADGRAVAKEPRAQEEACWQGTAVGQMIHRSAADKREIIYLVKHSALPIGRTLAELDVPRSSFSRKKTPFGPRAQARRGETAGTVCPWYQQYQQEGEEGLGRSRRRADSPGTGGPSWCATRSSSSPSPAGEVGSATGLAVYPVRSGKHGPQGRDGGPGRPPCLRIERMPAAEAL
jgi:hypothetical protein